MEFLTEEVIAELGITPEQLTKLNEKGNDYIADLKKDLGKTANDNAEKILEGAIAKIVETTKITRNQGEKIADYVQRASESHLSGLKNDLETAKAEYNQKVKDFKGDETTKAELDKAKDELDKAKQQLADFDTIKEKAEKYETTVGELSGLKLQVAFQSVKPNFPDTVDEYRAKAKWDEFITNVKNKYTIELVDGEAVCKDKENEYKTIKLKDLVDKDEAISLLMQGRKQQGSGAGQKTFTKVDGVPFEIPNGATNTELSKLVRDHLLAKGVGATDKNYSSQFEEIYNKAKSAKQ